MDVVDTTLHLSQWDKHPQGLVMAKRHVVARTSTM
jgi:hypothetical protein